ncbi:DUF485 domain-containing protein [Streptomyces spongiae]|uniref:DUF485 domain-containing protein n=1 Tax=Streptomyces spongiae TaxID=565072 RepID=A0A5N8X937_9ACTN|nr:hypothetical protein [Streptomyces spongiae]MPY56020.1 hypothetical protein [Streptomyces spongiae]
MYIHDRPPGSRPPQAATDHLALQHLRRTSGKLRVRLLVLNLSAVGVPLLLDLIPGIRLAAPVFGPFTLGMLVLGTAALTLVVAALWYERACRVHCDPRAEELRGRAAASESALWGRS